MSEATQELPVQDKARTEALDKCAANALLAVKRFVGIVHGTEAREARRVFSQNIAEARRYFLKTVPHAMYRGKDIGPVEVPTWDGKGKEYKAWYATNVSAALTDAFGGDIMLRNSFLASVQKDVQNAVKDLATAKELDILGLTPKKQSEREAEAKKVAEVQAAVPGSSKAVARRILGEQDWDIAKATAELRKETPVPSQRDTEEEMTTDNVVSLFSRLGTSDEHPKVDIKAQAQALQAQTRLFLENLKAADGEGIPGRADIAKALEVIHADVIESRSLVATPEKAKTTTREKAKASA